MLMIRAIVRPGRVDAVLENHRLSRWAALLPRDARQRGAIHETDAELLPLGDGRLLAVGAARVGDPIGTKEARMNLILANLLSLGSFSRRLSSAKSVPDWSAMPRMTPPLTVIIGPATPAASSSRRT